MLSKTCPERLKVGIFQSHLPVLFREPERNTESLLRGLHVAKLALVAGKVVVERRLVVVLRERVLQDALG